MSGQYVISKCNDGWAITVDGSVLLVCKRKKAAIQAVEDAIARDAAVAVASSDPGTEPEAERCPYAEAS